MHNSIGDKIYIADLTDWKKALKPSESTNQGFEVFENVFGLNISNNLFKTFGITELQVHLEILERTRYIRNVLS